MKLIFALALLLTTNIHAQSSWTGWQLVYGSKEGGNVSVSFKIGDCRGTDQGRTSYYRTKNEMGASAKGTVSFSFDFLNCANETKTERVTVSLDKAGIDQNGGMWFMGVKVLRVYDVQYSGTSGGANRLKTLLNKYTNHLAGAIATIKGLPNWSTNPGTLMMEYFNLMSDKLREGKALLDNQANLNMSLDQTQEKINELLAYDAKINDMVAQVRAESQQMQNKPKQEMKIPCSKDDCPPGFKCKNGFCENNSIKPLLPKSEEERIAKNSQQPRLPCDGSDCPPGYTCSNGFCVAVNAKPTVASTYKGIKVLCDDGACPPGYDCRGGYCIILTKEQKEAEEEEARRNAFQNVTPENGFSSNKNVISVSGNVNPYFKNIGAKLFIEISGVKQEVSLSSDGHFSNFMVLSAGNNNGRLILEAKGRSYTRQLFGTYTGRPTKIRVTLTWDRPGDLDLHLKTNNGECFYQNKSVNNMNLDVDNTQGYGPENISVINPSEKIYSVNIHDYSGVNGAVATVYIFINERLTSVKSHVLNGHDWWNVEDITLP